MALEIWEFRHDESQVLLETVEDGQSWHLTAQTTKVRRMFAGRSPKTGFFARLVEVAVTPELFSDPEELDAVCEDNNYLRAYMRPGEHHKITVEDEVVAAYDVRYRRRMPGKPLNPSPDDHDLYM